MSLFKRSKRENNLVQKITFIHKYFAARALKKVLFTSIPFIPFAYVYVEAYTSPLALKNVGLKSISIFTYYFFTSET